MKNKFTSSTQARRWIGIGGFAVANMVVVLQVFIMIFFARMNVEVPVSMLAKLMLPNQQESLIRYLEAGQLHSILMAALFTVSVLSVLLASASMYALLLKAPATSIQ